MDPKELPVIRTIPEMFRLAMDRKIDVIVEPRRVTFGNPYYDKHKISRKFRIGLNVIAGVAECNLALLTQLIKEE